MPPKERKAKAGKARASRPRKPGPPLGAAEAELVARLAAMTGLLPREVLERALAAYAAAVAPGMVIHPAPAAEAEGEETPPRRLFLSVDGKAEREVEKRDFVLGSAPDCDLHLGLPLISPRHARILWREGRHLFEDLHSARGSFRHGEQIHVRFIEDGDEIDLGGFLPIRFRLA